MTTEWARFRKYTRRMRELSELGTPDFLSPEVFSVLQLCAINEPFLPNLKTLDLLEIREPFILFIPLLLSPGTTAISLEFKSDLPKVMVASTVSSLPKLCPELQAIHLFHPSEDPMIAAAVSEMLLATNRNILQMVHVEFPVTEEAGEMIFKLSGLRSLLVVIEGETSLPSASLPNLTKLGIGCDNEGGWPQLFHDATFGKLESVVFFPESEEIGDFLGAFERVALSSSVQNTLLEFHLYTSCSWHPNYSSLLPFTQLVELHIEFSCDGGCTSRVDDDIIINLSRAMPKLQYLRLGEPCREFTTGVTAKGLVALALHCPNLSSLCVHFQVDSLIAPPASPGITSNPEPTGSWTDCALTELWVGEIPVPEESVLMVTLTLLRIFPRIQIIYSDNEGWDEVEGAIRLSKRIVDCSSKQFSLIKR